MEMSDQLHAPAALSQRSKSRIPIWYEAGWVPRADLDAVVKRKIACPFCESNPGRPVVQSVVSHVTD